MNCLLYAIFATIGITDSCPDVSALDYGNAFYHPAQNSANNVYMRVESRMKIEGNGEYVLLAPHPRETTFANDGQTYNSKLAVDGPSTIIFMIGSDGLETVLARRYANAAAQPVEYLHQCTPPPYGSELVYEPATIDRSDYREIFTTEDLKNATAAGSKLVGIVEYQAAGKDVSIDFPITVLNWNPKPEAPDGQQWQFASPMIPIYVPDAGEGCHQVRNGYVAASNFETTLQFVYLCDSEEMAVQDYACTANFDGRVRVLAKR